MRHLQQTEVEHFQALNEQIRAHNVESGVLIEQWKARQAALDLTLPGAEEELASIEALGEEIDRRAAHERTLIDDLAGKIDLDLERPNDVQLAELMSRLDGNRRLGGTRRPQRQVARNRKGSRRRR